MSDELIELPEGWKWTTLEDLCLNPKSDIVDGPFGSNLKASEYLDTGVPIIRLQNVDRNVFIEKNIKFVSFDKAKELDRHSFEKGDIIITKLGEPLGKACLVPNNLNKGIIVADIVRVRISEKFALKKYILYVINSQVVICKLQTYTKGTTRPRVNLNHIRQLFIPLPPLNEQKRIVAKIEELNDRTQRAKEALETIPQLCDRFRQSVLAAAFRGDLTADWREQNPDVEPASVLLERTLQEKRDRTKNQLKHNELNLLIESELEELPKGWHWTTFEQVSERVTVGHVGSMKDEYISEGIPFLRSQNVRENRFDPIGLQYISKEFHKKLSKSSLQPGDLVVVRSGSVGITCVIPNNLKEANCSDLVIVKQPKAITPYYGSYYMNSVARSHVNEKQVGVALIHFNTKSMAQLPIPIAPYKEQEEIIGRVQKLFKSADTIEQQYQKAKTNLDQLNQSILAKAFRGELVPQDPDDEPASELLERIRAEREKLNNGKQKSQRTSKRKSKTVEEQGV
ncbi:restriction endonuclease subunit S [Nostoc sp. NMS4]|uniref:restriction endonuclease subunit S n=1 Tax=Nostoc sp. NMS4 TaxID=2815390 RepID=UPI0025D87D24|nr:restriction endonuclease subunit S [Nostoc sp. NMS4]MBN3923892.1 restriction endonuclease subunit S [Nostoc sp. NMS4]